MKKPKWFEETKVVPMRWGRGGGGSRWREKGGGEGHRWNTDDCSESTSLKPHASPPRPRGTLRERPPPPPPPAEPSLPGLALRRALFSRRPPRGFDREL